MFGSSVRRSERARTVRTKKEERKRRVSTLFSQTTTGGFAMAGSVTAEEYATADIDPVKEFSRPIAGHMNGDHQAATIAIMKSVVGIDVNEATIVSVDSCGMEVLCKRDDGIKLGKIRIPFKERASDRGAVKGEIVKLTQEAAATAKE